MNCLWYERHPLRWILLPFAWVYQVVSVVYGRYRQRHQQHFSVPIIVVGNLTVGGTGKTPLVIALTKAFQARGLRVGIVSRGYRARLRTFPYEVNNTDTAEWVGDEPLLLTKKTGCPVVIAPNRVQGVQYLLEKHAPQIILSDDGLQHYALGRAIEIAVIDGERGLGNGLCLPAGPLREGKKRLQKVDFLVVNGGTWPEAYRMDLIPGQVTHLKSSQPIQPMDIPVPIAAVAAIGNPERFFTTLNVLGISFKPYAFADHYNYQPKDFIFNEKTVVMTEKDAVKCQSFATEGMYFLPVEATLSQAFWDALWAHEQLQDYA